MTEQTTAKPNFITTIEQEFSSAFGVSFRAEETTSLGEGDRTWQMYSDDFDYGCYITEPDFPEGHPARGDIMIAPAFASDGQMLGNRPYSTARGAIAAIERHRA